MEVVEKIDSLNRLDESDSFSNKVLEVTAKPLYTPKQTVYNACVEFIKWYNLNK